MAEFDLFLKNMAAVARESFFQPKITTEQKRIPSSKIPQVPKASTPGNRLIIIDHITGNVGLIDKHGNLDI
jgi:hypothetical protein